MKNTIYLRLDALHRRKATTTDNNACRRIAQLSKLKNVGTGNKVDSNKTLEVVEGKIVGVFDRKVNVMD